MKEPFELEWLGGPAAKHFRSVRPKVDELPWGTLAARLGDYPQLLLDRARVSWTEAAYNEYCTAAAFAELLQLMLQSRAPLDLIGMASDFVADEILHVELTSRIAMELGGGAPYRIDFEQLTPRIDHSLGPRQQTNELMVRLCCVGEAFSIRMLAGCLGSAAHPLTRAVLERIVQDEAPHGRLGWLYLDWAEEHLDDVERKRLADVALEALQQFEPFWKRLRSRVSDGVTSEGFLLSQVHELGWMESSAYARTARETIRGDVVAPLARRGIVLPPERVAAALGAE
jgi:hypothetical protein